MSRIDHFIESNPDKYPVKDGMMDVRIAKKMATDFAKLPKKPKAEQVELIEHPLVSYIKKDLPGVAKMKLPTFEQCEELIKVCGKVFINEKLKALENIPRVWAKYQYVHLTIENWFRRGDIPQQNGDGRKKLPKV